MTASELHAIRERLGLGPVDMGRALGVSYTTYRDWQSGRNRIPPVAARCAELLCFINQRRLSYIIRREKEARK